MDRAVAKLAKILGRSEHCYEATVGKLLTPVCLCPEAVSLGVNVKTERLSKRHGIASITLGVSLLPGPDPETKLSAPGVSQSC